MWMPARRSRSVVAGPTPGMTDTCIGRSRSVSVPGGTTTRPSGLSRSLATLAMNFEVPIADRRGQPTGGLGDLLTQPLGERRDRGDLEVGQACGGQVDEGLVERQRLHQRGGLAQHRHHQLAGGAVGVEAAAQERRVRAPRPRLAGRHGRPDAVLACFVRRRRDHPAPADAADHDRLAAQRGLVALLDGGEERVEVEVQHRRDRTHGRNVAPGAPWAAGAVQQGSACALAGEARPTPSPIIERPPDCAHGLAAPWRPDEPRPQLAGDDAHALSETMPMAKASRPSSRSWTCT